MGALVEKQVGAAALKVKRREPRSPVSFGAEKERASPGVQDRIISMK